MEIQNKFEKMHYKFKAAYENFVEGHNNPAKFAGELNAIGFSRYWPLNGEEKDAAYSGIYSGVEDLMGKILDKNEMKSVARDLLDIVVEEYNDWIC